MFGTVIRDVVEVSHYPYHLRNNCREWLAYWDMWGYSKIERDDV